MIVFNFEKLLLFYFESLYSIYTQNSTLAFRSELVYSIVFELSSVLDNTFISFLFLFFLASQSKATLDSRFITANWVPFSPSLVAS